MKIIRILVMLKYSYIGTEQAIRPHMVRTLKLGGVPTECHRGLLFYFPKYPVFLFFGYGCDGTRSRHGNHLCCRYTQEHRTWSGAGWSCPKFRVCANRRETVAVVVHGFGQARTDHDSCLVYALLLEGALDHRREHCLES